MAVTLPEELTTFGVTNKDFKEKKNKLSKSGKKKVDENEVILALFEDLAKKAKSYEILQMLYWNIAVFKDKLGDDSFKYQQKSHQARLKDLKQNGKEKVKINASGCCAECAKLHNLVLPIKKALRNLPVPNPKCEATLFSEHIWCTSIFLAAKDKDKESKKLPPPVEDIPEEPELAEGVAESDSDSPKRKKKNDSEMEQILEWMFPAMAMAIGLGLAFFSPVAGALLVAWSIPFFPPLMMRLRRFAPFLNHSWSRRGILGLGFLLALLLLLLTLWMDQEAKTAKKKGTIPPFQVLVVEDQSTSTRTRLQVRIVAPEARTARDRARVAMYAAQQMQRNQMTDNPKSPKYEYVSVVLEASADAAGQGFALAEAEYAPDGRGREGIMSDSSKNQWQWNVKTSKTRVDPNNISAVQGTLEHYLKK